MRFIKKIIQGFFNLFGLNLQKTLWRDNKEFMRLLNETRERRLVSPERSFMIWQFANYAANKEGDMAEVGVYKGGTAKIIARSCLDKTVHLFDTFSGIPKNNPEVDFYKRGDFSDTSLDSVSKFLGDCKNVYFHSGFFPSSAEALKDKKFCFVHVDVDIYDSVKDCLYFFFDRMTSGGVMLFDDWQWKGCLGVKKAISEFLKDKKEIPIITASFQCAIIKL